jgi:hypothetical protein
MDVICYLINLNHGSFTKGSMNDHRALFYFIRCHFLMRPRCRLIKYSTFLHMVSFACLWLNQRCLFGGSNHITGGSRKERLMHKFKLNDMKSEYVTEIWANRSDEERTAIAQKIAAKQAANMSAKTIDERREITAKARAAINREKQGKAASRGLKNWWAELRKNPGEYAAYIQSRSDSRKKAKHENL